jgi:hypothetical protein
MSKQLLGNLDAERRVAAILSEDVISLAQAEKLLGETTGHKPARATVCRWINTGRLEAIKLGRQLFTSEQAVHRFLVERTATIAIKTPMRGRKGGGLPRAKL